MKSVKLPAYFHEFNKMIIMINRATDGSIIVIPFITSDLSILIDISERLKEFNEDLLFSHFSLLYFRVMRHIVDSFKVSTVNSAKSISIELKEGFVNHGLSSRHRVSSHSYQKLIEVYLTIPVNIE
jgi:hypothetical protein